MPRNLRFKVVYWPRATRAGYSFYLKNDPRETADAGPQWPAVEQALRARLEAIIASDPDVHTQEPAVSSARKDHLRSLGYVE
jgi:hypothetical protein